MTDALRISPTFEDVATDQVLCMLGEEETMVYPDNHKEMDPKLLKMGQSSWTQLVYTYGINNPKLQHSKLLWSFYSKRKRCARAQSPPT